MQGFLEAVSYHAATVGMDSNATKTKVMSALTPDEQRQAVLLDVEPLEDVDKFKYFGSMFLANGQGTEDIRSSLWQQHSRKTWSISLDRESSVAHDGESMGLNLKRPRAGPSCLGCLYPRSGQFQLRW